MFDLQNENRSKVIIPGYTGHIPSAEDEDQTGNHNTGFYIPGYAGFVKGIKSENMYGKTFGEASAISIENQYHKGHELPPNLKFKSSIQESYGDKMKEKSDYFFSFTRLTKEEVSNTKQDLRMSRSRDMSQRPQPDLRNKIDVDIEQMYAAGDAQIRNAQAEGKVLDPQSGHVVDLNNQ